jgi:hypothetical protein
MWPSTTPRSEHFWRRTNARCRRYDNLKNAVKKILRGRQREETSRLIAFRSHWGFQTDFCNPARECGAIIWFQFRSAKIWSSSTRKLLEGCRDYEHRRIAGKPMEVGAAVAASASICCRRQRKASIWRRRAFRWWMEKDV